MASARYARTAGDEYVHIVVAERALGRPMPIGAEVHHVNEDKRDNRNRNLVICQDRAYHGLLHKRARIVRAGGDPNTQRICYGCDRLLSLNEMSKSPKRRGEFCKRCTNENSKRWRDQRRQRRLEP